MIRRPMICIRIGTIANIIQLLKLPDGTIKVLVEGTQRVSALDIRIA